MKSLKYILLLSALLMLVSCSVGGNDGADGVKYQLKARVNAVNEKIEVEIIESPDGSVGPLWIITSDTTKYYGKDGKAIARADIAVGDTVTVSYSGQVMMSYPGQIVAYSITVE